VAGEKINKKDYHLILSDRLKSLESEVVLLQEQYQALNQRRDKLMVEVNLATSPDGKYKTLVKIKKRAHRKALPVARKMIKIAEKMQKKMVIVDHLQENLKKVEEGTYFALPPFIRFQKYCHSIPYDVQHMIWGIAFCLPWFLGFIFFFLIPLSQSVWWSFNDVSPAKGGLNITFAGLGNYIALFSNYVDESSLVFTETLFSSLGQLVLNLLIVVIFSLLIAIFLNTKFKGNGFVKAIFFIPVIFNTTAVTIAMEGLLGGRLDSSMSENFALAREFTMLLRKMSLPVSFTDFLIAAVDQIFAIVNMSGVQILIFLAAIQSVPRHLYEAAKIEGATRYEMFWKITFPMVTPIFLTVVVYTVVQSFANSDMIRFMQNAEKQMKYGLASTIAVIFFVLNFILIGLIFLLLKSKVFYYDEK
jgi:ABC-type sugar transport system permease subunit